MAKRKSEDVVFCCNVGFLSKQGTIDNKVSNRIYSFSPDDTWDDVLSDLLKEIDESLGKADTVEVAVSAKKEGTEIFYPDYDERIEVIRQFDKSLKFVTFKIKKIDTQFEHDASTDVNQNVVREDAFGRLMGNIQTIKKQPKLKGEDGLRFTGDVLHGIVFVRLQLSCNSPIEWAYYSATATRKDICCYCALENTERNKELLKDFRVVLPVCGPCERSGLQILKRLPIKK